MSADAPAMIARSCPVCGAPASAGLPFLERFIDSGRLNAFSYASRKAPEYMRYRLLRCRACDVVYACESPAASEIGRAYHEAAYDSKTEARHAAESYVAALAPALAGLSDRRGVLDIGTGTGVFLQLLRDEGFTGLTGVEPSKAAIAAADPDIRPCLREGLFDAADFQPASFALICCFMTLEHVPDPAGLMRSCRGLLKPGGRMAVVVHDWRAWNNRLLGSRAPIIDIEHLQLFSRGSIEALFRESGYPGADCFRFRNRYRLDYWNRLLPTPPLLKRGLERLLHASRIGRLRASLNVGNLMAVSR